MPSSVRRTGNDAADRDAVADPADRPGEEACALTVEPESSTAHLRRMKALRAGPGVDPLAMLGAARMGATTRAEGTPSRRMKGCSKCVDHGSDVSGWSRYGGEHVGLSCEVGIASCLGDTDFRKAVVELVAVLRDSGAAKTCGVVW